MVPTLYEVTRVLLSSPGSWVLLECTASTLHSLFLLSGRLLPITYKANFLTSSSRCSYGTFSIRLSLTIQFPFLFLLLSNFFLLMLNSHNKNWSIIEIANCRDFVVRDTWSWTQVSVTLDTMWLHSSFLTSLSISMSICEMGTIWQFQSLHHRLCKARNIMADTDWKFLVC